MWHRLRRVLTWLADVLLAPSTAELEYERAARERWEHFERDLRARQ